MIFNGDKIAQWAEEGCQQGGNYKCGSRGVPSNSFIDAAHCNQVRHKSLSDIQDQVLGGVHGGRSGYAKPLEGLTIQEVQQELAAQRLNSGGSGDEARGRLVQHLEGLQRVPLLLINNPRADIKELHLEHYAINDYEPLHKIKVTS